MQLKLSTWLRVIGAFSLIFGSVALISAVRSRTTVHDKAYYANAQLVAFVRPGLQVTILAGKIASDGAVTTTFQVADPQGLPLDKDGITSPGAVTLSFVVDVLPKGQSQYTPYTADVGTNSITGDSVITGSPDDGGTLETVADGKYIYTFNTKAPTGFDASATHTIGIYAARDLSDFDLGTSYADTTFNFVPNGTAVVDVRDVV